MSTAALLFAGQLCHAALRTAAIRAIANNNTGAVVTLNAAANLVRLLVLSGGVLAVVGSNWVDVAAVVMGQALGDWLSMRYGQTSTGAP